MKTVEIESVRLDVTYRTNSEMRTRASFSGKHYRQGLSCDVYDVEDGKHVALILNSVNGDILNSTTVITSEEYDEILDLYDPYHTGTYHTALLERCGAENHLKIR